MSNEIKHLKNLSFQTSKNGDVQTGEKNKVLRESTKKNEAKPAGKVEQQIEKLLNKIPAKTFVNDGFDHVTSKQVKSQDDGRGNSEFIGTHQGTRGSQSLKFEKGALEGTYNREAVIGGYVDKSGAVTGKYGDASYDVHGKGEASASVHGDARLDSNGLVAHGGAQAHASVEVTAHASAKTKSVEIFGEKLDAAVEANARATAELNAQADGTVQLSRRPPEAIISGKAGVSAVAKVEGDIHAHAGPFSIDASAYGSAGAEATASGMFGYHDGKLTIGGSAGAAFGLGAGGNVNVELDVGMIKDAAHNAADRNHDGKLDIKDVGAGLVQGFQLGKKLVGDRDHDGVVSLTDAKMAVHDWADKATEIKHNARTTASRWLHKLAA